MKRILLLTSFLLFAFAIQAQEKLNYQLDGNTVEFTISQEEIYVEFILTQKIALQQYAKQGFTEMSQNSAIVKLADTKVSFQEQKQNLQGKFTSSLERIEPVLIYSDGTKQIANGELNIKLKASASIEDLLKGKTFTIQPNEFEKGLYLVKLNLETSELFKLINQLQKNSLVEFAEPNFIRMIKPHTDDPFFSSQWTINNQGYLGGSVDADMDVDEAWNCATGTGIKVAIIDTGVDLNHPDLLNNLLSGYDATGGGSNGNQTGNAHGTACAGIVAGIANNSIGVAGIAYNAKIIPVKIFPTAGSPTDNMIANGINWAWQNGADVLSNSYGGGSYSSTIANAINNAVNNGRNGKGSVVLFSSGNDNGSVSFPSTVVNAISVGASSMCDERKNPSSCDGETWWGSNYGTNLDIVAPGVKIYTTDISGSAGYSFGDYKSDFNGTSSACPNAAGVMALILSANPNLTQQEARGILESNVDKVSGYSYTNISGQANGTWNSQVGYGRVNACAAVLSAYESKTVISGLTNNICISNTTFSLQNLPPGVSVSWNASPSNLFTVTTGTGANFVTAAATSSISGQGTITATVTGACGSFNVSKTVWVGIPGTPTITGPNPLCYNQQGIYQILGDYKGAESFLWSYARFTCVNNCSSNIAAIGLKATLENGQVYVRGQNECGTSSGYGFLYVSGCGGYSSYSVYPNPTADVLYIKTNSENTSEESFKENNNIELVNVSLFDFSGNLVISKKIKDGSALDIKELPNGHYVLHIKDEKDTEVHHIIVE